MHSLGLDGGQLGNPGSHGKWLLKWYMNVFVTTNSCAPVYQIHKELVM